MHVLIIAEAGVNHNGDVRIAKELVDAAKSAGADVVKFQTFVADDVVSYYAPKAHYQLASTDTRESHLEMLRKLELSFSDFVELSEYCAKKEIEFLSTAHDFDSIDFLYRLNMKRWKIASGDVTNLPYLVKIARFQQPVILSTGMSTMQEVETAVSTLRQYGANEICLLHCTTEYPAPYEEVNLRAMDTLRHTFNVPVGYSDHTRGIEVAIAAVALGAVVIEKHFTLDRRMIGPDHKASLEPPELEGMITAVRNIEIAMGDGTKQPTESELKNVMAARKSIVAKRRIQQGEYFTELNLTVKRPGNGISPMEWFDVIGRRAPRDFEKDEMIEF